MRGDAPAPGRVNRLLTLIAVLAAALVTGGCSRPELAGNRIAGHTLTIYSSLPLEGPSAAAARTVLGGELLAFHGVRGRIGRYALEFKALDDATVHSDGWDPGQTTLNARLALQDPTTIGYIGEFNSGASAVAIPLLGRAGIVQISPTSTAVGLTTDGPGASPGEPARFYPTGGRTFVALPPNDALQADVQARLQRSLGCTATYVLNDGEFDGYGAAASFQLVARSAGLTVVGSQDYDPRAQDYSALALAVARTGADCVLISALPQNNAALLTTQIAAALPRAQLFATGALAQPSFVDPARGGIPADLDSRLLITAPAPGDGPLPRAPRPSFSRPLTLPGPYGAYGYEAMHLLLAAIARATSGGTKSAQRSRVLADVFATRSQASVLGLISVRRDGSTTLRRYAVYRVVNGHLEVWYVESVPR